MSVDTAWGPRFFAWLPWFAVTNPVSSLQTCSVLQNLRNLHCYGLVKDESTPVEAGPDACRKACCNDENCEVWQFNALFACYRGKSDVCIKDMDSFTAGSLGERLRGATVASSPLMWYGKMTTYTELVDLDPAASEPREEVIQGVGGENYRLWRNGSVLQVDVSCWSFERHPEWCCPWDGPPRRKCWGKADHLRDHCCKAGMSPDGNYLYNVYARLTPYLAPAEQVYFNQILPEEKIDEALFTSSRLHWASGHHPSDFCPSTAAMVDGQRAVIDGSVVLWPLAMLLAAHIKITGTFVNIGAGTCLHPDPLYQLLASREGSGFLGLAVEADSARLQRCEDEMAQTFATVVPVSMTLNPIDAARQLRPYVAPMFPNEQTPWPLDFLVVDLDGCDCLVAEGLMDLVRPKVLMLEIAFHFPPPFRFSAHWDVKRSHSWNAEYDVDQLNPSSGCSLSYAIHKFKPFGYHLLRLTHTDAVFVHESVRPSIESGLGLQLPQDEFLCYRRSTLWVQLPGRYVREWFYAAHPSLALSQIWSNITELNKQMGRDDAPFTLDF